MQKLDRSYSSSVDGRLIKTENLSSDCQKICKISAHFSAGYPEISTDIFATNFICGLLFLVYDYRPGGNFPLRE
jgi:hypothetical protein